MKSHRNLKKNRYLNLWYYDGKYVVVKDEHNSFKFVYSMDGSKPPSEDDEWGSWKKKRELIRIGIILL